MRVTLEGSCQTFQTSSPDLNQELFHRAQGGGVVEQCTHFRVVVEPGARGPEFSVYTARNLRTKTHVIQTNDLAKGIAGFTRFPR